MSSTLTNGADYAGVACCDWLLVNVQQTEMLQEGVGHACIQLLVLDKGVRLCHHLRVTPDTSCSGGGKKCCQWGEVRRELSSSSTTEGNATRYKM